GPSFRPGPRPAPNPARSETGLYGGLRAGYTIPPPSPRGPKVRADHQSRGTRVICANLQPAFGWHTRDPARPRTLGPQTDGAGIGSDLRPDIMSSQQSFITVGFERSETPVVYTPIPNAS
ncbi:MAG: hypothetical protein LAT83_09835, partial [Kiritimatiellae bacterium]|nr:hypothetical protein [Kiritimatiellia bacterium]